MISFVRNCKNPTMIVIISVKMQIQGKNSMVQSSRRLARKFIYDTQLMVTFPDMVPRLVMCI